MKKWGIALLFPALLLAKPKGGEVVSGHVQIADQGKTTSIHASDRSVIHWKEFSVYSGEKVQFIQPTSTSTVLNRVGYGVSQIDGLLEGNGRIFLINPNGVVISKGGVVKAAGFVGATLDLENEDFFKNQALLFKGKSQSPLINLGTIKALGGDVILLAKTVINEGKVKAKEGVVALGAGNEILLKPSGDQRLFIATSREKEKGDGGIENQGVIEAAQAELRADGNVYRLAINQTGIIEATGTIEKEGRVFLVADGGSTSHHGKISAINQDQSGGKVCLLGDQVKVFEQGTIDVSAPHGGGEVLLGGDFQGKNSDIQNASLTALMVGGEVLSDALEKGDGGKVIVWADGITLMEGKVFARGGPEGGDGGVVEVSGLKGLSISGQVDTRAPLGKTGELLLDPTEVNISTDPTNQISFNSASDTYVPVGNFANLNNTQLGTQLNLTNVTVTTSSLGGNPGNITVSNQVSWSSDHSLTLRADAGVFIEPGSNGISNTGNGNLTMLGIDGDIEILDNITLAGGNLVATAQGFILVNSNANPVAITTTGGDITFNANAAGVYIGSAPNVIPPSLHNILVGPESGSLTINCSDVLVVQAPEASSTSTILRTGTGGTNTLNIRRDLILNGGSSNESIALIGRSGEASGPLVANIGRNLIVHGGPETNNPAILGVTHTGSIDLTCNVGQDVKVIGGGEGSFAVIGGQREIGGGSVVSGGTITMNAVGGDVIVQGGPGAGAFAHIGFVNGQTNDSNFTAIGNVFLNNILGNVTIQSNGGSAAIGFGNPKTLGDDHYSGSVRVKTRRDVKIHASGNTPAFIGFGFGGTLDSTVSSNLVQVNGRNIIVNAASGGDAYIGLHSSDTGVPVTGSIGLVNVIGRDSIRLNASSSNLFNVDGSSAIGAFAENGDVRSNISVQGGDVYLNTLSGSSSAKARIMTSEPSLTSPHQISIQADNLYVGPNGQIHGAGNVLAISNFSTFINSGGLVQSNGGSITLVVDHQFPNEPDVGNGEFTILTNALLNTNGGPLRIFTALRSQNTITAPLNGVVFIPGPMFADSPTEQWKVYYPSTFGGNPYTIFYKTGVPAESHNRYARVIGEMFQDLKIFDELLFDSKYFLLGYDKYCYDRLMHPKGMVSSFDLFGEEFIELIRQKYRNYHLKFVESF